MCLVGSQSVQAFWGMPTKMSPGVGFISGGAFASQLHELNVRWISVLFFVFI